MVEFKLYVEGGGTGKLLRTECRAGFSTFLGKAGMSGAMPRIVACGSRGEAYNKFCTAVGQGQQAFLLVDSESPLDAEHAVGEPETWKPWEHLRRRAGDGWSKPAFASDTDCHLMVQIMESWFLTDKDKLSVFSGKASAPPRFPLRTRRNAWTRIPCTVAWKARHDLVRPRRAMEKDRIPSKFSRCWIPCGCATALPGPSGLSTR